MIDPYWQDTTVTLYQGNVAPVLQQLPAGSVDCVVTSPPYYGLRSYLPDGHPDKAAEIGSEATPTEYLEALGAVFREVHRVLADDGTCWVNLGDTYSGKANAGQAFTKNRGRNLQAVGYQGQRNTTAFAPYKSLMMMPERIALALVDDGWTVRNKIVWAKPNAMPESVRDRLANRHETLYMLTKSPRYYFNLDAIRDPASTAHPTEQRSPLSARQARPGRKLPALVGAHGTAGHDGNGRRYTTKYNSAAGRNPGDVWAIPTAPFPGAHFATFPPEIPRRCIAAGCRPAGTVLDPFHGSGTTGAVAERLGRRYIGIDLSAGYLDLSLRTRLAARALPPETAAC